MKKQRTKNPVLQLEKKQFYVPIPKTIFLSHLRTVNLLPSRACAAAEFCPAKDRKQQP